MNVIPGLSAASSSSFGRDAARSTVWQRTALAAAAVGLLAVGALSATLWQRHAAPAAAAGASVSAQAVTETAPETPTEAKLPQRSDKPSTQVTAARTHHAPTHAGNAPQDGVTPLHNQSVALPAPSACADCGVVETVTAVTHKGPGTGLGAVAGGVLGGVVGNQFGGGAGRSAMTVLGAIGGGLAGNEIEKRQRATTDYRVTVRMDDGSVRSLTQSQAPAVGQAVRVDGSRLVPESAPRRSVAPQQPDAATLQTSART